MNTQTSQIFSNIICIKKYSTHKALLTLSEVSAMNFSDLKTKKERSSAFEKILMSLGFIVSSAEHNGVLITEIDIILPAGSGDKISMFLNLQSELRKFFAQNTTGRFPNIMTNIYIGSSFKLPITIGSRSAQALAKKFDTIAFNGPSSN